MYKVLNKCHVRTYVDCRILADCQTASVDYHGGAYCLIVLHTAVLAPCAV